MRVQGEDRPLQTKERGFGRNQPCHTVVLDFQPPEVRNICLVFKVLGVMLRYCSQRGLGQRKGREARPLAAEKCGKRCKEVGTAVDGVVGTSRLGPGERDRGGLCGCITF